MVSIESIEVRAARCAACNRSLLNEPICCSTDPFGAPMAYVPRELATAQLDIRAGERREDIPVERRGYEK